MNHRELADAITAGERRALSKGITLVESRRRDHQEKAQLLLDAIADETGRAHRVGISGTPGVGKSTFVEAFGLSLTAIGHKVAVLAVDPSSPMSGGSILGDKTRMEALARDESAFIRPSPSQGQLGGVARKTREAMLLCEAAGYDVVIIETVGTGQSETAVSEMVDTFVLLIAPGGGDELQGVKRGVLELCDVLLVNKSDGDLKKAAERTAAEYRAGLELTRGKRAVPVVNVSAKERHGLGEAWDKVLEHKAALEKSGELADKRAAQAEASFWHTATAELLDRFRTDEELRVDLHDGLSEVRAGSRSPTRVARALIERFLRERDT